MPILSMFYGIVMRMYFFEHRRGVGCAGVGGGLQHEPRISAARR